MTASQLLARATREANSTGLLPVSFPKGSTTAAAPKIPVQCNLKLASCRKWLALAEKRLNLKEARVVSAKR